MQDAGLRYGRFLGLAVACLALSAPAAAQVELLGPAVQFPREVVTGAPFSAEATTEMVQILPDGTTIRSENKAKLYRDGAGRTRREDKFGTLGPWVADRTTHIVFILDPVAREQYVLYPDKKAGKRISMSRMRGIHADLQAELMQQGGVARMRRQEREMKMAIDAVDGRREEVFKKESLGSKMIAGVNAEGRRTTMTIPAGTIGNSGPIQMIDERWFSPELKIAVQTKRSDPRYGEVNYTLSNIQRTEPLTGLFLVPAGFAVESEHDPRADTHDEKREHDHGEEERLEKLRRERPERR